MNNSVVIIPFHFTWNWPADYLRQTAYELAKSNEVFCFLGIEPIRISEVLRFKAPPCIVHPRKHLWLFRPIQFIPFERFRTVHQANLFLNILLLQVIEMIVVRNFLQKTKILWICNQLYHFFPSYMYIKHTVLYDCVDYSLDKRNENNLIQRADEMTVNSYALYNLHSSVRKYIHTVPQGFRLESFNLRKMGPVKMRGQKKPIIGMVGTLDDRIDFRLLFTIASRNPQWTFVIWGKLNKTILTYPDVSQIYEKLKRLSNVIVGNSPASEIPGVIKQFDVGIIPYDITILMNKFCYPMKLFEYFYMGVPVVSTPIEELKRFPKYVFIGSTVKEWEKYIKQLLSKQWPKKNQNEQRKLAEENSWKNKIQAITTIISQRNS